MDGEERCTDGIGRQDHEQGVGRQQLAQHVQHFRQVDEQIPDFALWPAAIFRRIQDDAVISAAAPHFARHELAGIFQDPADGQIAKAGEVLIFTGVGDRLLRSIHMGDMSASRSRQQRGKASVAEKVQNLDLTAGFGGACRANLLHYPVPVWGLLRKHAHMAEGHEAAEIARGAVGHFPGLGHAASELPAAWAFFVNVAGKDRVRPVPHRLLEARQAHSLRLWPDNGKAAIALQLLPAPHVQQGIVLPPGRFEDHRPAGRGRQPRTGRSRNGSPALWQGGMAGINGGGGLLRGLRGLGHGQNFPEVSITRYSLSH